MYGKATRMVLKRENYLTLNKKVKQNYVYFCQLQLPKRVFQLAGSEINFFRQVPTGDRN